jgi:hypothetical protein
MGARSRRREFQQDVHGGKKESKMARKGKTKKAKVSSKRKQKKTAKSSKRVKRLKPQAARKKAPVRPKVRKGQLSASEKATTVSFDVKGLRGASGGQSGDLQGISDVEGAASESVNELLEEGNAFEAEVVAGVERAGNADEKEVRTHEVSEDDVPEEYRDQDRKDRR